MFKIALTETYEHPITVEIPGDKKKHEFVGIFNRFGRDELDAMRARISADELDDKAFSSEVLAGWRGVRDADGNEMDFTPANLDLLLDIYPVASSIVMAFYASISGAKLKN